MNRRKFIGIGVLAASGCRRTSSSGDAQNGKWVPSLREERPPTACLRAAHQTAGPFYVKAPIMRSQISESQLGRSLSLELTLVEEGTCTPRPDVLVSLFHANADGIYSGFEEQGLTRDIDTRGQTWLRGGQVTDANGRASFETIYPGWYTGRVTHVHLTAEVDGKLQLTTQIYFPDDIMRAVYAEPPYLGWRDTEDSGDSVRLKLGRGELPRFAIEQTPTGDRGTVRLAFKGWQFSTSEE